MDNSQPKNLKGNLLIVDDDLSARQTMEAFLAQEGYEVRCVPDGETGLILSQGDPPELILLNSRLPDMDGFEVCQRLKEDHRTRNIPVIFISSLHEVMDRIRGFEAGGVDYITKPFQTEEILARVETHLSLKLLREQIETKNVQPEQEVGKSKVIEEKIKQAAEEWRTTFDSIKDLVSIHDKDFRILKANKAFAATLGMEIKELLGKKCYEIIHGTGEPWPNCPHRQTLECGKSVTEEFLEPRLGRYLQISASPILNGQNEMVGSVHIARDITERKRAEEALQRAHDELEERVKARTTDLIASEKVLSERLRFEALLAELSAHFINLPADQVDSKIEDTQRHMCELLHLDRSALWQVSENKPGTLVLTHIHPPPGIPRSEWPDSGDIFPWTAENILKGKIVTLSKISALPPEARRDRESFQRWDTKATVVVPLSAGGRIVGALSFSCLREERDWPETIVTGFQLLAQVFANALERKRAEQSLHESEARLNLAAASAEARLWELDLSTGLIWTTEKGRNFYGLMSSEELTFTRFLSLVHPEDQKRVRDSIEEARSGRDINIEFRVAVSQGDVRWVTSRGRLSPKSSGKPDRVMGVSIDITEQKRMEFQLKEHLREIEHLKSQLETENVYLKQEIKLAQEHDEIVGESEAIKKVLAQAEQVAQTDSTVLIQGETGTGKELLARAIHKMSSRKDRHLVTVNCASLPPTLIESELFGREKGAYTGALTRMIGRFEVADESTLFLDEIAELPLELQSKLLRVLEEGTFERLGSTKTLHVNVRIIAATNQDIEQRVKEGRFRRDLFYRLKVFPIVIPSLSERPEDIPLLIWSFVKEFQKRMGKEIETIPKKTIEALQSYSWPGNVRELKNVIEHAMIVSGGKTLIVDLPKIVSLETDTTHNLEAIERKHIVAVLERTGWRVYGKDGAAEILGLNRSTLVSRMKKLGIHRPAS